MHEHTYKTWAGTTLAALTAVAALSGCAASQVANSPAPASRAASGPVRAVRPVSRSRPAYPVSVIAQCDEFYGGQFQIELTNATTGPVVITRMRVVFDSASTGNPVRSLTVRTDDSLPYNGYVKFDSFSRNNLPAYGQCQVTSWKGHR